MQLPHSWTDYSCPHSPLSSSGASSWNSGKSQQSGPRTPSPPNSTYGLSESAPASVSIMRCSPVGHSDEGIEVDDAADHFVDDYVPRKRRVRHIFIPV